jgi:hypothetical protein
MRLLASVVAVFAAGVIAASASCGNQPSCSAEKSGFSSSEEVTPRALPSRAADQNACNPHLTLVTNADDLAKAYAALSLEEDAGVAPPAVDFTHETVVVREDTLAQGVSWVAVRGSVVTLGLQGCLTPADGCTTTIFAVPAVVTSINTQSCDPVSCGFTPTN